MINECKPVWHTAYIFLPSIRTFTVSLSIRSVVPKTRIEKIKVHMGSMIFHSG